MKTVLKVYYFKNFEKQFRPSSGLFTNVFKWTTDCDFLHN